jgi:hypothetical protein
MAEGSKPKQAEETRGCKRRLSSDIQFLQSIEGLFSLSFFLSAWLSWEGMTGHPRRNGSIGNALGFFLLELI